VSRSTQLSPSGADRPFAASAAVSVLVPSYGYRHYLRDAIESVLRQPDLSSELIVQDGGSTDGTVELLESYGDALWWTSEHDDGQSDALNRAWARARGRWIGWLNADEFYLRGGLGALIAEGERTGADVVYGDTAFVDAEGRLARLVPEHPFSGYVLRSYGCFISTVSCIVRRSALGPDPLDVTMRRMMDWDLYLRLDRQRAGFAYVPVPVGAFRQHDTRVTATETRGFLQRLNLGDGFGREYDMLRRRHGAFRHRRSGHILHGAMKLTSGAYGRQLRARRLGALDLRWFEGEQGQRGQRRLLAAAYPRAMV
jgi:glycosyltransferase involved in cell wall biosynthesis